MPTKKAKKAKPLISIVDDDESVREATEALMTWAGCRVQTFPSAIDFLASSAIKETSCLIADINMPEMKGVELYRHLVSVGVPIPTILITAFPDDEVRAQTLAEGVICYLIKPFDDDVLLKCVRSALHQAA